MKITNPCEISYQNITTKVELAEENLNCPQCIIPERNLDAEQLMSGFKSQYFKERFASTVEYRYVY